MHTKNQSERRSPAADLVGVDHPALRQRSTEISEFDSSVVELAGSLERVTYEENALGAAAPQIGINKRIVALRKPGRWLDYVWFLVNPTITCYGDRSIDTEGCLSLPNVHLPIERWEKVDYRAQSLDGDTVSGTLSGLEARCLQHEIDHLDGILIVDRWKR